MCCNIPASFCSIIDLLFTFFKLNGFKMCKTMCVDYNVRYH